ncbi:MAG: hypothetical protein NZ602_03015 [Thermoguttaceae bacterium]|nr:hypothetical protein [Thermoguttaceae bacterium]MDW8036857.1 hypothetical protein [Thermoguttaceae bacterium]
MVDRSRSPSVDIDALLQNADLWTELEPYYDEAIERVGMSQWPIQAENEFLACMLAWEYAPVLPIYRWFEPELRPPRPDQLSDDELPDILYEVINKLWEKRIVLDFTDHLSDRELYTLIYRDILPAREKKLDLGNNYLHWDCTGPSPDPEIWLRYYASDQEREEWARTYHRPPPPKSKPPYPRRLPREPE